MRILFCDQTFPEASNRLRALLPEHELILCSDANVTQHISDADVVVPLGTRVGRGLIERGTFGLIQQFGVGLDPVDIAAATRAGVWVARVPSADTGNADSVAEHALLLMLTLSRELSRARRALRERRLGEPLGTALLNKTACVIGLGGVGRAVCVRLRACGMRVLGVHEYPERGVPSESGVEQVFSLDELPDAVAEADYVVMCLNYDASRHNFLGHAEFAALKPGAFLINVARGGLIDPDALLEALQNEHLAGAGLDVFWEEPVDPSHPIFSQNVVATPHIAGATAASYNGIAKAFADNIGRYAQNEVPRYTANQVAEPRRRAESRPD